LQGSRGGRFAWVVPIGNRDGGAASMRNCNGCYLVPPLMAWAASACLLGRCER